MKGCLQQGRPILLQEDLSQKRRCRHTWKAIKLGRAWVGTDTHLANELVEKALVEKRIPALKSYQILQREPKVEDGRFDFLLKAKTGLCYVEVKSATVALNGIAQFPDSVTPRAIKHLEGLMNQTQAGNRAIVIFVSQRDDVRALKINRACSSQFTATIDAAITSGVEIIALKYKVTPQGFGPPCLIPIEA